MKNMLLGGLASIIFMFSAHGQHHEGDKQLFIKEYNIKLHYPHKWAKKVKSNDLELILLAPRDSKFDMFKENLSLKVRTIAEGANIEEVAATSMERLDGQFDNFEVLEEENSIVYKLPAYIVTYKGSVTVFNAKRNFKFKQIYLTRGDSLFIFTYTAEIEKYDAYIKQVNNILKSVSFEP